MNFFDYLTKFNVQPIFILAMVTLFFYGLFILIKEIISVFNKFNSVTYKDLTISIRRMDKEKVTELIDTVRKEEERKQKEEWLREKVSRELNLKTKLALTKVWKRSCLDGHYQTPIQENGCAKGANEYNTMLLDYGIFCKSINEEPNSEFKFIKDIYNKGEDFVYGTEPEFFLDTSDCK